MYSANYNSPLGAITLQADDTAVTGLWFVGQKYYPAELATPGENAVLRACIKWLDVCFSGRDPGPVPPVNPYGTEFQRRVWLELLKIPYGQTATYGELAAELSSSPRAVGGAVGKNPISIIIPCHRVIGADGSLTGYAGGTERKRFLLTLENPSRW